MRKSAITPDALPHRGTAAAPFRVAIGLALAIPQLQFVNVFIQGPFWLCAKILTFLFVYVWMRGTLPRFRIIADK